MSEHANLPEWYLKAYQQYLLDIMTNGALRLAARNSLRRYVPKTSLGATEVDDLLQDAYIVISQKPIEYLTTIKDQKEVLEKEAFDRILFVIIKNLAMNKGSKASNKNEERFPTYGNVGGVALPEIPEDEVYRLGVECIERSDLDNTSKRAFALIKEGEELSNQELADKLGLSIFAARNCRYNIRKQAKICADKIG